MQDQDKIIKLLERQISQTDSNFRRLIYIIENMSHDSQEIKSSLMKLLEEKSKNTK